ncbi:MAG: hypothetical protein JXQ29_04810 [Planctomycetes bacterium]|nr:hypothetical protein [Planctomycetota bacterium]
MSRLENPLVAWFRPRGWVRPGWRVLAGAALVGLVVLALPAAALEALLFCLLNAAVFLAPVFWSRRSPDRCPLGERVRPQTARPRS